MAVVRGWVHIGGVVILLLLLVLAATTYTITAIIHGGGITWTLFFSTLALLTAVNSWLLYVVWRRRAIVSPIVHVGFILWGGVALWYWTFAPLYYALNMHLNAQQLTWTAFAFLWEVPVIGGGVLTTIGIVLYRAITLPDTAVAYQRALKYPGHIALLLFSLTCVGYVIGAWQLGQFAAMSWFELTKSMLNGPLISIFPAVFYYLTFDSYLDQLRRRLSQELPDLSWPVRHIRNRLAVLNVIILLGSVGLLGLLVVESFQRLTEKQLATELNQDIVRLREAALSNPTRDLQTLARGGHGYIATVAESEIDNLSFSAETKRTLSNSEEGVVRDLQDQGKMIGFLSTRPNERIMSVVYLTAVYDFMRWPDFTTYGLGSVLVVVLSSGIFMFVVFEITRALTSLRQLAQDPKQSHWNELAGVHTGDEIEAVGRSFMRFVQKAKEVDKVKQEFVTLASHQLRTPLTAIRWYVELLAQEHEGPLTAKQREYLERIEHGNLRMIKLVKSLLNVSRIDSGRLSIKPQAVDLIKFTAQLIEEILPQVEQSECKIAIEEYLTDPTVWIDPTLLRQVMHNLFTNALKYRAPDRPCHITVVLGRDQQRFTIAVKDNGVGIPREQHHRVFDRFFRADNAAASDTEGTGLGLYMGKMLLNAAGCSITFTSERGKGSEFKIVIPKGGMLAKPGEIGLSSDQ